MRILIQREGVIAQLATLMLSETDGSLYLSLVRAGDSPEHWCWDDRGQPARQEVVARRRTKKISLHSSGRINFEWSGASIFVEPLVQTKRATEFVFYRVPSIERLDPFTDTPDDEDVVLSADRHSSGPIGVRFVLGPRGLVLPAPSLVVTYFDSFCVGVAIGEASGVVPEQLPDGFSTFVPVVGPLAAQQISVDEALVGYHRARTGKEGIILYSPNGEGVWRMVFSPKWRAPDVKIEFLDPDLEAELLPRPEKARYGKVVVRFFVRERKSRRKVTRSEAVRIRSVELDAEI